MKQVNTRQRKDGSFEARKMVYGHTVSAYGKTAKEAQSKLTGKIDLWRAADDEQNMTFGSWLTEWQEVYKAPRLRPKSLLAIFNCVRLHIPEKLKAMRLNALKPFELQKAINAIPTSRMRKYTYDVYAESLRKACALELIPFDPMLKVEPVRHTRKQGEALDKEEQRQFIDAIKAHPLRRLFMFYLLTGARRNEALTLLWQDIDIEGQRLTINGTKTAGSNRTIPLFPDVLALLLEQPHDFDSDRVFIYSPDYVTRAFHKVCPRHKLHDLRHTFATRCIECGISIRVVQKWLGHSSLDTTSRVYTHVLDDFQRTEAAKFHI